MLVYKIEAQAHFSLNCHLVPPVYKFPIIKFKYRYIRVDKLREKIGPY